MITEMAGIIGFIPGGGDKAGCPGRSRTPTYAEIIELDVNGLPPQVALPPSPNTVKDLAEVRGIRIDSGFIGSCTNGRTEDFARGPEILKGHKVRERASC